MQRNGRDPTRRNRNQGTRRRGHGQDNRFALPSPRVERFHLERVDDATVHRRMLHDGVPLIVLETQLRAGFSHPCSVDDVEHVLRALPKDDLPTSNDGEVCVVLWQQGEKETVVSQWWGSLWYCLELENDDVSFFGPAIYLGAAKPPLEVTWSSKADVVGQERRVLMEDVADDVHRTKRETTYTFSLEAARRMQMEFTLLHEVGHWMDYRTHVLDAQERAYDEVGESDAELAEASAEWDRLAHAYWQRSTEQKERWADRYAAKALRELRRRGVL